jgi:RNA polymerase sigma factor (sigma-70 family)
MMRGQEPPTTDVALLRGARTDAAAFEEFYMRWAVPLHAWVRSRVADPEVANDLTAETFAQALLCLGRFKGERPGSAAAWLWGIARNLVSQHFRTARLDASARVALGIPRRAYDSEGWDDVDARAAAAMLASDLTAAMSHLTADQRRAVELRILDGLDFGAVAADLECNEPAARMRVSRALHIMRARLQGLW